LGGPRGRAALAAAGAILLAAAAIGGSPSAAVALRAGGVLAILIAAAWWIRRRAALRIGPAVLAVEARQPLTREVGLALVAVNGQRLLLGYGPHGVSLLVTMPPSPAGEP
jgi:flagellar biogenesis protein FliO